MPGSIEFAGRTMASRTVELPHAEGEAKMADVTITVALEGEDISLASFATAVSALDELLKALSSEVASDSTVAWDVDSLHAGSAIATVRGRVVDGSPDGPARVSAAYEHVGDAMARREPVPYPPSVQRPASKLAALLQDHVVSIRMETPQRDYTIAAAPPPVQVPLNVMRPSLGAVEGRIQTLSSRGGLRFTLFDTLEDQAVSCYLSPGKEDMIQQLWGRLAIVEGEIRRDPLTGRPTAIRRITAVTPVEELGPDAWREARGALPWDGEPAEVAIRRVRDGW